jgi:hypothetical protein
MDIQENVITKVTVSDCDGSVLTIEKWNDATIVKIEASEGFYLEGVSDIEKLYKELKRVMNS